jgi:hypothetical protein
VLVCTNELVAGPAGCASSLRGAVLAGPQCAGRGNLRRPCGNLDIDPPAPVLLGHEHASTETTAETVRSLAGIAAKTASLGGEISTQASSVSAGELQGIMGAWLAICAGGSHRSAVARGNVKVTLESSTEVRGAFESSAIGHLADRYISSMSRAQPIGRSL